MLLEAITMHGNAPRKPVVARSAEYACCRGNLIIVAIVDALAMNGTV